MGYIPKRMAALTVAALAFGVAVAVLKGGGAGVRDSIGNMSAPWLLLPYFAGTLSRGWKRGALTGAVTCLAAVTGFYVAESVVLDLGDHPWLTDLALTLGAGRYYFAAALVCGPLFGAIGGARTRWRHVVTAAVVGLALIGEPLVLFAWLGGQGMAPSDSGMIIRYAPLWIGEMVLGLLLSVGILTGALQGAARPLTVPFRRR